MKAKFSVGQMVVIQKQYITYKDWNAGIVDKRFKMKDGDTIYVIETLCEGYIGHNTYNESQLRPLTKREIGHV